MAKQLIVNSLLGQVDNWVVIYIQNTTLCYILFIGYL